MTVVLGSGSGCSPAQDGGVEMVAVCLCLWSESRRAQLVVGGGVAVLETDVELAGSRAGWARSSGWWTQTPVPCRDEL